LTQDPSWTANASVGNLERVTTYASDGSVASTADYAYTDDRATAVTSGASTLMSFGFDQAGRTATKAAGGVTATYAFDVEDQLKSIQRTDGTGEQLEYGPTGELLWRKEGTTATWYVGRYATVTGTVSASCSYATCVPSGVQVAVHVLLAGARVASIRSTAPGATTPDVLYYHRDRQGSVVATTVTGGLVGERYRYAPYGSLERTEVVTGNAASELGYTGGQKLSGGLLLLGARVYDPEARRWLSPDAVDLLRYTYVDGDPANFVDPSGRRRYDPDGPRSI
jgi:RHS repeat-associated protein